MSRLSLSVFGEAVITVGEHQVTPSAPHLFALLLLLGIDGDQRRSRQELQQYLFPDHTDRRLASHSLRQLLYRIRQMGVPIDEQRGTLCVPADAIEGPFTFLHALTPSERAEEPAQSFIFLPSYAPVLPRQFIDWLDRSRDALNSHLRALLLTDMQTLRDAHDWRRCVRVAARLNEMDPASHDVVTTLIHALAMTGQQRRAVEVADNFLNDAPRDDPDAGDVRRLRSRIAKRAVRHTHGPVRGRTELFACLRGEWERAEEGGARLALIIAAPGLGKTRVLEEFGATISLTGVHPLHHGCDGQSQRYPLSLFSSLLPALRAMKGSLGADPRYRHLLDQLSSARSSSPHAMPEGLSIEVMRAELQAAVLDLFEAISSEQRVLVLIDDAHLLDDASCAMVHALSRGATAPGLLVVAACRPRDFLLTRTEPAQRVLTYRMTPLDPVASRELFLDFAQLPEAADSHVRKCLSEAGGNPFYIRSLAQQAVPDTGDATVPFDIRSLAASSYYGSGLSERLVLDTCLLLGDFATLDRVALVSSLDTATLITALRQLEDRDLVRLDENTVRGPHALLHDAMRQLIPSTVFAALHRGIARTLDAECTASAFVPSLALAAAESWIAAGEPAAALGLTHRCAAEAAALGEPAAAADLLNRVSRDTLPSGTRVDLLDALLKYADAGACRDIVVSALRERIALALEMREPHGAVRLLELRLLDAEVHNGRDMKEVVPALKSLIECPDSDGQLKCQAIVALLIVADAEFDGALAEWLRIRLADAMALPDNNGTDAMRARLVYQTAFGEPNGAASLVRELTVQFPEPSLDEDCRKARRFASFALYRLQLVNEARQIVEADYAFMSARGIRSEAFGAASLLTELAIAEGNFALARDWFAEGEIHLRGAQAHRLTPISGYHSSAAVLLMMEGRYDEAVGHIPEALPDYSRMRTSRYQALCIALRLRLHHMRGELSNHGTLVDQLRGLYALGKGAGGQDSIVEMLWCAEVVAGRAEDASLLLREYLTSFRRELGDPEWLLRTTTAADPAWSESRIRGSLERQCPTWSFAS